MLDMQPNDSPSALVNLTSLDTVLVAESLMYKLIDVRPEPDAQKSRMLQDRGAGQIRSAQHTHDSMLSTAQTDATGCRTACKVFAFGIWVGDAIAGSSMDS